MEENAEVVVTEKKENAPLSFMQRLAYTIIDFGLMLLAAFGLYQICLHTPISNNLHNAQHDMNDIQIQVGESTGFFIKTYLEEGQDTNYTKYQDEGGVYYYTPSSDKDKKAALIVMGEDNTSKTIFSDSTEFNAEGQSRIVFK